MACLPSIYPQSVQSPHAPVAPAFALDDPILNQKQPRSNSSKNNEYSRNKYTPAPPLPAPIGEKNGSTSICTTTDAAEQDSGLAPWHNIGSPKSRKFRESGFPQPSTRGFSVTHTNKGLYARQGSEVANLTDQQVRSWEQVATPRADLDRRVQLNSIKAENATRKSHRVSVMLLKLEMTRGEHQIHLTCLVNEAGCFQRHILSRSNTKSNCGLSKEECTARLQQLGLPTENPYRKTTFMLSQPKMWKFLLADIATLLADPTTMPDEEEPATPRFVADQVYSLNLFQQSNFVA